MQALPNSHPLNNTHTHTYVNIHVVGPGPDGLGRLLAQHVHPVRPAHDLRGEDDLIGFKMPVG